MPITYDITKDSLYLKGIQDAEQKGKKQWEESGRIKEKDEVIKNLLKLEKLSIKEIAIAANTTIEHVLQIKEGMENKK